MKLEDMGAKDQSDSIVTGPRPLLVCPVCGPKTMMYAGNIIAKTCARCEQLLREAR